MTSTLTSVEIGYDRTVSRALVHRWSLSEVFLTDYARTGAREFVCGAQLPLSHGYFRDHIDLRFYDSLNILEACRQAATCAVHLHEGAPSDISLIAKAWSLTVTDPDALVVGVRPGELRIDAAITERKVRGNQLRHIGFAMALELDGARLGELTMDLACAPIEQYRSLRHYRRGDEPPTAYTLATTPTGTPTVPLLVQRRQPVNSVLDDLRVDGGTVAAILSPRTFANRSMYDHPYDHVPAMVLSEAARQCALVATDAGKAHGSRILSLDGEFTRFGELDRPILIGSAPRPDSVDHRMVAAQDGREIARVDIRLG
ncbi:AfsA-related hotdog domain-containing protein [Nocardia terpenica]|uniref:A-factor biosynthesis hotdog domain-containing protein n=1 Tax=Nocardia terpenica TaxID=455432 RepID=A0A291RDG1_9NOCA|nr:AfsA-related hotdog domain-containing protein [Nocardia terpenica]ATL65641.1 hypothetical protein CRH09_04845 [Nocardia terpenica]